MPRRVHVVLALAAALLCAPAPVALGATGSPSRPQEASADAEEPPCAVAPDEATEPCTASAQTEPAPPPAPDAGETQPVAEPAGEVVALARSTAAAADVPFVPAAPRRARAATVVADALQAVQLPAERRCVARRRMAVRIDVPQGAAVVDVTLSVDGRRALVRRGRGRWSTATLRALPRRAFTVEAAVRLADETTLRAARRYRPCRG